MFSHQSGAEWLLMANFAQFTTFPIFLHQNGSDWLEMANFALLQLFQSFPTEVA